MDAHTCGLCRGGAPPHLAAAMTSTSSAGAVAEAGPEVWLQLCTVAGGREPGEGAGISVDGVSLALPQAPPQAPPAGLAQSLLPNGGQGGAHAASSPCR